MEESSPEGVRLGSPTGRAVVAAAARPYAKDLVRLAHEAPHARHLAAHGRAADVTACFSLDAFALVPTYRTDVDKVVSPYR